MSSFGILISLLVAVCCIQGSDSATASGIARYARRQIDSHKWLYSGDHETGSNTNKCNIFVADVLKHEGADAPNRWPFFYTPIGANEWAKPESSYLTDDDCWERCTSPITGDVIAKGGHVGIVTGYRNTTSASADASPAGLVVENDWGFRSYESSPTCWRFNYSDC